MFSRTKFKVIYLEFYNSVHITFLKMALFALKHSVFPNDVMISQKRVWSGLSKDLDALIDATFGYIPPASSLYYCQ